MNIVVCQMMTIIWHICAIVFVFRHYPERALLSIIIAMLWMLLAKGETE